jgi:hypothetical protein
MNPDLKSRSELWCVLIGWAMIIAGLWVVVAIGAVLFSLGKRFLFLLLLLPSLCWSQPIQHWAAAVHTKAPNPTPCIASVTDPSQIAGLAFRWVASDASSGQILTDRIQGNNWYQNTSGNRPTKTGNHLVWNGTSSYMNTTNVTLTFENNCSFYLIMNVTDNSSTVADAIFITASGSSNARIRPVHLGPPSMLFQVGGTGASGFYTALSTIDFVYAAAPSGHDNVYTNGILYYQNTSTPQSGTEASVGQRGDGVNWFQGSFYEMGIYTNKTLSTDEVCSLHYYATNTYGFTP